MAGRPKKHKMIETIKKTSGYNGIPLPSGCPTFLSVLTKTLNKFNSFPNIFNIDDKTRRLVILKEAMQTFETMINYYSNGTNCYPRFFTDNAKIITGTMKSSKPKRVKKNELSICLLKHASIVPDLIPKMSSSDMAMILLYIDGIHVSRQAVSSNPIYKSVLFDYSNRYSTVKRSDYSKTHRFKKPEDPDETT